MVSRTEKSGIQKSVDWEAIERDFRAGVKTLRAMADEHGITHGAINKRAKKDGWTRDLSAKIAAKAQELVSREAVSKEVSKEAKLADNAVIAANAEMQKDIILSHRNDVRRSRTLVNSLLAELEAVTAAPELFEQLAELIRSETDPDKLMDAFRKVVSLPVRVDSLKKLAETLRILIAIERQAFGLDNEDANKSNQVEDFLELVRRNEGG